MRATLIEFLRAHRVPVLLLTDSFAWLIAVFAASLLRLATTGTRPELLLSNSNNRIPLYGTLVIAGAAVVLHALLAWVTRLHQGRSKLGSFEEIFILVSIIVMIGSVITIANLAAPDPYIPRTTAVVAAAIALLLCAWPRGLWRILVQQGKPNRFGVVSTPVLVVGAGDGGQQLVQSMLRDPRQTWRPVGFVDDDKHKRHFRFQGVRMIDGIENLGRAATKTDVNTIIIAMPSASGETISRINDIARAAELNVKVLPGIHDFFGTIDQTAVRDLSPEDMPGRRPIDTDLASIAGYLHDKRVLITGAGGSIGSELCRQIAQFAPAELLLLDRDESALHALTLSLNGRADLESSNVILANIREADRMFQVFEEHRPEVVFHTAALKHVNMLEGHASEGIQTNVLGSLNVLQVAASVGVERFVNISTDKAADPENVLGYTKRIAEGLTSAFASTTNGTFLSVRFGNVLGTRGSVLKTFAAQVEKGGPVTVTDPNVTRYFMTIQEAVQLVIQAAAIGRDGEALVLDMGAPVKIDDLAHQVIEQSGKPISIIYTGLKPGEKMHEVLIGAHEVDERPAHPLVSHVQVMPISRDIAVSLPRGRDNTVNTAAIKDLCEVMAVDFASEVAR